LSTTLGLYRPRYENEYFAGLNLGEANNEYKKLDALVISYLKEMGVPTAISEKIMSTPSNRAVFMTTDEYIELAGSRPPAFDEWLIAQCGSMSTQEILDLSHAGTYEALKPAGTQRRGFTMTGNNKYREAARKAAMLSAGYRDYLVKRLHEIDKCEKMAIKTEQAKYATELIKENQGRELIHPYQND